MISDAVRLIADELGSYIALNPRASLPANQVQLYNIADLEQDQTGQFNDHVLLSLVNVEEESTLKNARHFRKNAVTGGIDYVEPPVNVNLYLLFSATYDSANVSSYEIALLRLSLVIEFFQSKRLFTVANSPGSSVANDPGIDPIDKINLRLILEQYTLTFEQLNHLWGSLGGRQLPHVMFKGRLVKIQGEGRQPAGLIEEIDQNGRSISTLP